MPRLTSSRLLQIIGLATYGCFVCRKRKRIIKRKNDDENDSDFSFTDEQTAQASSDQAPSDDTASFQTDSELSDDPLGEYDDADDDLYEQRRHKYSRGWFQCWPMQFHAARVQLPFPARVDSQGEQARGVKAADWHSTNKQNSGKPLTVCSVASTS